MPHAPTDTATQRPRAYTLVVVATHAHVGVGVGVARAARSLSAHPRLAPVALWQAEWQAEWQHVAQSYAPLIGRFLAGDATAPPLTSGLSSAFSAG